MRCVLRVYPGQRGRGVEQLPVKLTFGKMAAISSVASSSAPRMRSFVSASDDKTVRLWHVGSGKQLKELEGHR